MRVLTVSVLMLFVAIAWSADQAAENKTADNKTGEWPYAKWVSAKAYTYNFFNRRFGVPYLVYEKETGWSRYIRSVLPLTRKQAHSALKWTIELRGDYSASKCPFPRHAVVFFNKKGKPVGSVNVCFECGDVMVWPKLKRSKQEIAFEKKQDDIYYRKGKPKPDRMKTYDRIMAEWKTFFGRQLGMPIDFKNTLSIP